MHVVLAGSGTPYYISPEIWESKPYGKKSDGEAAGLCSHIHSQACALVLASASCLFRFCGCCCCGAVWSLGVILFELLALDVPFKANSLPGRTTTTRRSQQPTPPSPSTSRPSITSHSLTRPSWLLLVLRCRRPHPEDHLPAARTHPHLLQVGRYAIEQQLQQAFARPVGEAGADVWVASVLRPGGCGVVCSKEMKELVTSLLHKDPSMRPSVTAVLKSPYLQAFITMQISYTIQRGE